MIIDTMSILTPPVPFCGRILLFHAAVKGNPALWLQMTKNAGFCLLFRGTCFMLESQHGFGGLYVLTRIVCVYA
jgi:hypothetical protein